MLWVAISQLSCGSSPTPVATANPATPPAEGGGLVDAIGDAARSVAQAASGTGGSVDLALDPPLKIDVCLAKFQPAAFNRSAVIQFTTQKDPAVEETFPALYLWAEVKEANLQALVGKTIEGSLFVQRDKVKEIWHTSTAGPVAFQVSAVDALTITLKLENIPLERADGGQQATISGTIVGAIQ